MKFDKLADPRNDDQKQVEVAFDARVLRYGAEFSGWIYASDEPQLKQQVEPGNATFRFRGDVLSVRTPLDGVLLQRLHISSPVCSPNGDGTNDEVRISYEVRDLNQPRLITVEIFDLSGHLVRKVSSTLRSSGNFDDSPWDGRGDDGHLVPPGSCVLRVSVATDRRADTTTRVSPSCTDHIRRHIATTSRRLGGA